MVRHGAGPAREIQTGIGPLPVQRPKVRDRANVPTEEKIRFNSRILPKWARRSKSLDALLPALYLRGLSTGDVQEALAAKRAVWSEKWLTSPLVLHADSGSPMKPVL